jgi:subtilisin-like proprotein convertase family protein
LGADNTTQGNIMAQYIPTDPLFGLQWELLNTGQTGFGPGNIDFNVTYVWPNYTGRGVTVAVYDNGVDYNHADLNDNYDASKHVIIDGSPDDANWLPPGSVGGSTGYNALNHHGTGMAGGVGAENNGVGTVGIAFDATIVGVHNPIFVPTPGSQLIQAFQQLDNFDVALFASGGRSYRDSLNATGWADIHTALQDAVSTGRGGLGTIIVNSVHNNGVGAGNFDTNASQWDATRFAIHAGGITDEGVVNSATVRSAAMLVSGVIGSFQVARNIKGLDISGADGASSGDYNTSVVGTGTTAASTQIAGIAALMLEANAGLGWRDVQNILVNSARHTGSAVGSPPDATETDAWEFNGADNWNGGGRHYSIDYGYGYVDALAAVRMAETWHIGAPGVGTSANEAARSASNAHGNLAIPDNNGNSVQLQFNVADNIRVESAQLRLSFTHANPEDLRIVLTSPDGTASTILHLMDDGTAPNVTNGWRFNSQEFRGELGAGTWTVTITDLVSGNAGSLSASSALVFFGSGNTTADRYVYTNEFSDYAGLGSRSTLTDTDGDADTINAAAVTSASAIDLHQGATSTIDGQSLTIAAGSDIENAIGGDGNDTLTGNALSNILYGGRGTNALDGSDGDDTAAFLHNRADYTIQRLNGTIVVTGSDSIDTLTSIEHLKFADKTLDSDHLSTPSTGTDFNGDGTSDFLWQNTDGTPAIWSMSGTNLLSGANAGFNPGPDWHVINSADFNGDGKADILWQNTDGTPAIWLMDGANILSGANVGFNPGPSWQVIAGADFNGDGKADILWQNTDGTIAEWFMDGTSLISGASVDFNPGPAWHAIGTGDFNGDGKADILWQNADGTPAVWLMDGLNILSGANVGFNPGATWHVQAAGDFDGDGKADILWQNADGTPAIWLMDGTNLISGANVGFNPGAAWQVHGAGDFDGDGKADIQWQNTDGTPAVWLMNGTSLTAGANVGFDPGSNWHVIPQHHDLLG